MEIVQCLLLTLMNYHAQLYLVITLRSCPKFLDVDSAEKDNMTQTMVMVMITIVTIIKELLLQAQVIRQQVIVCGTNVTTVYIAKWPSVV